jgi:hypothetical protein
MKSISPNIDETRKAFDPFVYERWPEDAAAYQGRAKLQSRKWRKRKFLRSMLGWLPSSAILPRVLRGRRTQNYVHDSYSETWSEQDWPNTMGTPLPRELSLATWRGEGLHVRRGDLALAEISRVARAHVVMLEPFADFNQSPLNRDFVSAKNYFSLTLDDLSSFGIEVMATYDDFPQKLTLGQGLVVGKVA